MSVSRPIKYLEPEGWLTAVAFKHLKIGDVYYGVWKRDGRLQKFIFGKTGFSSRVQEASTWCEEGNERRAFSNYFHAYAYSLKVKERRRLGQPIS
jgi:hypothetical protein